MSQQVENNGEELADVNVIPLADLSLVLLIILMIMSPIVSQALISVHRQQAHAANSLSELNVADETPIIVSFEPGALTMNGFPMGSDEEFMSRIADKMKTRRDKSVIFTASPLMDHGKVVHVMDMIKRNGTESLVMVKWDDGLPEETQ